MANWEKLNKEFDEALDSMTKEDWKSWYERFKQKQINQNKMEKTALEFILNMVCGKDEKGKDVRVKDYLNVHDIEQAKAMEKEQIVNAFNIEIYEGEDDNFRNAEQYYNETFKLK